MAEAYNLTQNITPYPLDYMNLKPVSEKKKSQITDAGEQDLKKLYGLKGNGEINN